MGTSHYEAPCIQNKFTATVTACTPSHPQCTRHPRRARPPSTDHRCRLLLLLLLSTGEGRIRVRLGLLARLGGDRLLLGLL